MKKLYISTIFVSITLLFFTYGNSFAQIFTSGVPTTLCANEKFTLNYSTTATLNAGNVLTAQLSDNTGSFTTPINIGNLTTTNPSGTIYVTIPEATAITLSPTSAYRIRVTSTAPNIAPINNGLDIIINCTTRDYYWIGGTGDWSDVTHWKYTEDGGTTFTDPADVLPSSNDNANFDANSFPTGGTLNFDQFVDINDFYWEPGSGAANPTINANFNILQLKGDLILDVGVITNFYSIDFNSTKSNIEINYGDNILGDETPGNVIFSNGGKWELKSNMTANGINMNNTSKFSTNDYNLDLLNGVLTDDGLSSTFNYGSSNIRLGGLTASSLILSGTGGANWFFNLTPANLTGTIQSTSTLGNVFIQSGYFFFSGDNIINNLTLESDANVYLSTTNTLTVLSNFNVVGKRNKLVRILSNSSNTQAALVLGTATVNIEYATIKDINVSGSPTANNSIDEDNNNGWTFNAISPLTYYWVGGGGNWSDNLAHWGQATGGGGFHDSPPGKFDNIIFDDLSFPSGGTVFQDIAVECNSIIWTTTSGQTNPSFKTINGWTITVNGDFILAQGVNSELSSLTLNIPSGQTSTLDFADDSYAAKQIAMQGGGTVELNSPLGTDKFWLGNIIFNTNNQQIDLIDLNILTGSTSNWGSSIVNIRGNMDNLGGNPLFNADASTFNFSSNNGISINGSYDFNNVFVSGKGVYINESNTYNNLTFLPGAEIFLQANGTQTVGAAFNATGLRNQPISISSNSPGIQATISQATGTVNTEYLVLQDNKAAGGALFNTTNYIFNGNVTGWDPGSAIIPLTFYWVNGGGNWSDYANHWAANNNGSSMYSFAPGPLDDIIFSINSFNEVGQQVVLDNPVEIVNMTWEANSGNFSPILTSIDNPLTITGDLQMVNGVERNLTKINFVSNAIQSLNLADNIGSFSSTEEIISFSGGGTWNLQSPLKSYQISIEDATLNSNISISLDNILRLNLASSVINLGNSTVSLSQLSVVPSSTFNAGTSTLVFNSGVNGTLGQSVSLFDLQVLSGADLEISADISVNDLLLEPGAILTIGGGNILTINSITANGTNDNPIRIKSSTEGVQGFISQASGDMIISNVVISDNGATGSGIFKTISPGIILGDPGKVTGWNVTPFANNLYHWIGNSGNWSESTNWEFSVDGGTTYLAALTAPGINDDVFFDDASFNANAQQVIIDKTAYCKDMSWSTSASKKPILKGEFDIALLIYGSLSLADGVIRNIPEISLHSENLGETIYLADNQVIGIFNELNISCNGSYTLASNLVSTDLKISKGIFTTGNFPIDVSELRYSNNGIAIFNAGSSHIYANKVINESSSAIINMEASTVHIIDNPFGNSEIRGPINFNDVILETNVRIEGSNAYNSLIINQGTTINLQGSKNQFVSSLALNGVADAPIIINSSDIGTQATFSVPASGSVVATYVILEDNNATGGASFIASNSSDLGNVTGWSGLLAGQSINFLPLSDIDVNQSITLGATVSSPLAITYNLTPITGSATLSGNTLTPTSAGLVCITASQSGNLVYGAAQDITRYVHFNEGIYPNELGQMKEASYVVGAPNGVSEGSGNYTSTSLRGGQHAIVSPTGKLIVAGAERVMIWDQLPDAFDVPADRVVGQLNFTSNSKVPDNRTIIESSDEFLTTSSAIGPNGELIVSDGRGVLIWNNFPTTSGAPADVIIGQPNFTSTNKTVSANGLKNPIGIAVSNDGKLIIADGLANRVLIYESIPISNNQPADVVIGQLDFTSENAGTSANDLNLPTYVAVSPDNKLLITDFNNNRVLVYDQIPTANYKAADAVIGQNDFTSNSPGVSSNSLNFPIGVAVSRTGKLAIADALNQRVLIYNQIPSNNITGADLVLGQPDFNTVIKTNEDEITLRTMSIPAGLAWDLSENLLIMDIGFSRLMVYGAKDLTAPTAFATGLAISVGGTVTSTYFNASNTGIDVSVPIDNDVTLDGGTTQLQIKIGAGTFENIGTVSTILSSALGTTLVKNISLTELQGASGFGEGAVATFRAVISDIANNQTTGTESSTNITIDTNAPGVLTTGTITTIGGTVVAGYWNGSNTALDIEVPIANDISLDGGNIQLQVKIGSGAFENIGISSAILTANISGLQTLSITETEFKAATGYGLNAIASFRAVVSDVAGNQANFIQSLNTLTIDDSVPVAFTTGATTTVGGTIVSGYWNSTNTDIIINVPIDNDAALNGGNIQMQVKIGAGSFIDIGTTTPIANGDLGVSLDISIAAADLIASVDYAQDALITFRAIISNSGGNQTIGSESTGTFIIDTIAPIAFTIDNITANGGTVISGFWNSSNTSIAVNVPVDNDASLTGGSIQLQVKFGTGTLNDIGVPSTMLVNELGLSNTASISKTDFESASGYLLGEEAEFNAIMTDIAGNQTTGSLNGTTLTIDDSSPPNAFSTGTAVTIGGVINASYLNSTNTAIDILVPIENDDALDGGNVQIQAKIGAGSFANVGASTAIESTELGTNMVNSINKTDIEALADFTQNELISFRAIIANEYGNQTIGTESTTTFTIDTVTPIAYTTGIIITAGGNAVAGTWNNSNTSLEITVPIDNDPSLIDGAIQIMVDVDGGGFSSLGSPVTILVGNLGSNQIITLTKAEFDAILGLSNGAVLTFNSRITDIAGNATNGTQSTTTITIDNTAPDTFNTGNVTTIGGTVVSGYWNASNESLEIVVPIANSASLDGGKIQISASVDGVNFIDVGQPNAISNSNLGNTQNISLTKAELEALPSITEGSTVTFNASITDISENTTIGTQSLTEIIVDRVAPEISTNLPTTYTIESTTQPSITLNSDVSGINEVAFNYNLVSSSNPELFTTIVLTPDNTENYIANLKDFISTNTEQIGLIYYFTVSDNAGNIFNGTKKPISVKYPDGLSISKFGVGSTSDKYRMISVPLVLESNTLNNIFDEIYTNGFDKSKMRIFSYPGGGSNYSELTGSSKLDIGVGYISLAASNTNVSSPTGLTSFETIIDDGGIETQGFIINLVPGWNLIGNPYLHSVNWSDIKLLSRVADSDLDAPQIFDGNTYPSVSSIPTGEAAFIFNNLTSNVLLKIPTAKPTGGRIGSAPKNTNALSKTSWKIIFNAKGTDGINFNLGGFGMEENAHFSKDEYDVLNPPALSSIKIIDFKHPEFAASSFKNDIRRTSSEEKWEFEYKVESGPEEKHTINWDNSYFGEDSPELYLVDKSHFTTIDMKEVNSYTFTHTGTTNFEVYFGYDALEELLPNELISQSPFPNPFTSEITFNIGLPEGKVYSIEVRIFDSIGKEVKRIEPRTFEAGYTSIVWNGIDRNGSYIPSGIYSYKIQINNGSNEIVKTGKIIKR